MTLDKKFIKLLNYLTCMALESRTQKIIKQMQAEGKVTTLSREASATIDHELAMAFALIKKEFEQKEKVSRAYIADLESGRINLYKPNNLYQRAKNYLSNLFK